MTFIFCCEFFFSFNFSSGWVKPWSPVLSRLMRPVDSECTNINEWDFFGPENFMFSVSFILWRICNNVVRDYWCMFWTQSYWFPIDYLTSPSCSELHFLRYFVITLWQGFVINLDLILYLSMFTRADVFHIICLFIVM